MNALDFGVLLGGFTAIGFVLWFFFAPKTVLTATAGVVGGAQTELSVTGMTCAACVSRVEKAARRVPGVAEAQVNLLANRGTFTYDPAKTDPQTIIAAIDRIGFEAAPLTPQTTEVPDHAEAGQALRRRFWVAALLTLPVLWGGMGHDLGLPAPRWLTSPWLALALSTPSFFGQGEPFSYPLRKHCAGAART